MSEYYEHNTHGVDCWCNPKIEIMDNGNKVIIHNDIKPEEAKMSEILLAIAQSNSAADLFKAVRKARGLSILEVSKISGIHRNTIGRIENGNTINSATLSTLASIAHAINCDLRIELVPFEKFTQDERC